MKYPSLSVAMCIGFLPLALRTYEHFSYEAGGIDRRIFHTLQFVLKDLTGYAIHGSNTGTTVHANFTPPKWNPGTLIYGLFPILGGVLIHKVANRIGLNRGLKYIQI